jgi:hypothetical protein
MAQQTINLGTVADDGTGDTLRAGGTKINANFTELYAALTGLLDFKGSTDCSANPNYPAASKGDFYLVSVAGKIGGASGVSVEVSDTYFATADNAGGTQASVGTSWTVLQGNTTAAYAPGGTDVALADGGTGASLVDPNADRILFWDDSAGQVTWLTLGTNLTITGTTLDATGGGGGSGKPFIAFRPYDNEPPTSNYATLDTRNGHPCLDFDTTTQEAAYFSSVMPTGYAGGNLIVTVYVSLTSATSGTVGFDAAFERIDASTLDIDADSFATAQTITATTVPGTSGQLLALSVTVTAGAATDSIAASEMFRLRLRRDVANDTATGDAEVLSVTVREA